MAGDWIKVRCNLIDDPAVIGIASMLGMDEFSVAGRLVKLWSWANLQTADGNAVGVTESWLDRYLCATGFARAMQAQGWLTIRPDGLTIPKFDKHNGKPAKQRALTSIRVNKQRAGIAPKCNAASVTEALPEKRREEKREEEKPLPKPAKASAAPPKPRKPTERDLLFDAVAEVTHSDPKVTGSHIGKVVAALRKAEPPYTPEEVRQMPAVIASLGWSIEITLGTIEKHIGRVRAAPSPTAPRPSPTASYAETLQQRIEQAREGFSWRNGSANGANDTPLFSGSPTPPE